MCLSRTTSSFRVPHLGRLEDVIPEVTAQLGWGPKVDPPSQQRGEFTLHCSHRHVPGPNALTKLDKNINVAVGPKVLPQNRPEEAQFPETVFPAERLNGGLVELDPCHGPILAPGASTDGQDWGTPASPREEPRRTENRYSSLMAERSQVGGLDVIVEQDSDGWFVAYVPALAGCHTQARTRAELRGRIIEAVDLCLGAEPPAQPVDSRSNR